jgi:inner membrane protein
VKIHPLLAKTLTLLLVGLLLWLPLAMISSKINERSALQHQVEREIEATAYGPQRIVGPLVALECTEDYVQEIVTSSPRGDAIRHERRSRACPTHYFFPDKLSIRGELPTEVRKRGIYPVRMYQAALAFSGTIRLPSEPEPARDVTRRWTSAALVLVADDLRGLKNTPTLLLDERSLPFEPGMKLVGAQTLVVPLDLTSLESRAEHAFSFAVQLHGTSRLAFVPMAMNLELALQSSWQHPSFDGAFLPDNRSVTDDGFRAQWKINQFAAGGSDAWSETLRSGNLDSARTLGVSLIDPVNVYIQTYRATEYGILLIGLTFALFMLLEATKRWSVHPVQYGLIGLALAIFFLLLLALAEHIGFEAAYIAAAAACAGLLTFYVSHVAGSFRRGISFGGYFATLYGAVYVMLSSEDSALLIGSAMAFAALTVVMVATRRLDWSAWSASLKSAPNLS